MLDYEHTVDSLKIAGLKFRVFQFDAICGGLKFVHFAVKKITKM